RRLAELLAPFHMDLIGARRSPRGDEPIRIVPISQIDEYLGRADHVIDVLPGGEGARHFFSADRLARMQRSATFYNVGRGETVDQEALVAALQAGHLAGAYLDVTTPEPLPPEHPLWRAPNCWITPHIAGGQQHEMSRLVEHFLENLYRFEQSRPLRNRVI